MYLRRRKKVKLFCGLSFVLILLVIEMSSIMRVGETSSNLTIDYYDVGQGDCTLIRCGDEAMLIDAGDNSHGTAVQRYLKEAGITELKYCICTHPDADHIGGMDVVLTKFDVGAVIMTEDEADTATYRDVIDTIRYRNIEVIHPELGEIYTLGEAKFVICGPVDNYEEKNNNSIVIYMMYENTSFLWNGDAGTEAEADMLEAETVYRSDVVMIGHHGSSSSTSEEYLNTIDPEYAIISCGADNPYGHPHRETMELLEDQDITVYRTDINGTIEIISTGSDIQINPEYTK